MVYCLASFETPGKKKFQIVSHYPPFQNSIQEATRIPQIAESPYQAARSIIVGLKNKISQNMGKE